MTKNEHKQRVLNLSAYKLQETINGATFDGIPFKILIYPKSAYLKFDKRPNRDVVGIVKSFGGKWSSRFKSWTLALSSVQDVKFYLSE